MSVPTARDALGPIVGIIPAKGGSVRLARKNLRRLRGRSLLAWAARAAQASGILDRIVLSTEDAEVADEGRRVGLDVPFTRPLELARDPAGVADVALHALDELERQGHRYRTLVILLPTCPLRTGDDIRAAVQTYGLRSARFLMSVSLYPHTPYAALSLAEGDVLDPVFPQHIGKRSQLLPPAYRCNGAIHVLDVDAFRSTRSYYSQPLHGYVMPRERSFDIDTEADLREAEALLAGEAP